MKLKVEIDCTPEEARRFLGFPDVKPLNDEMMNRLGQAFEEGRASFMNPDVLMKLWMPIGNRGMEEFQNLMKAAMSQARQSQAEE